jgi:peptidoglycan/LPS O-acetylase OafA/YrhL
MSGSGTSGRLIYLDGLRGVAILLVFFFHAFARWPDLVPYGHAYSEIPLFQYGLFGVRLFFMISGFVILLTLEKCSGFADFMLRRWLRLFPAMLIASIVLFATAPLFPERPGGMPTVRDLLPGLTLIDPIVWLHVFGGNQGLLEWSFWSLFAEIKFYIVFGAAYFLWGRTRAVLVIFGCFAFSVLAQAYLAHQHLNYSRAAQVLLHFDELSGFGWFGWFASGAWFYEYFRERSTGRLVIAVGSGLIAALLTEQIYTFEIGRAIAGIVAVVVFALPLLWRFAERVAATRLLILCGFVSYPFYLLHEKVTISLLIKCGALMRWVPGWMLVVIPLLTVFSAAWLIATFGEPWARSVLRPPLQRIRSALNVGRRPTVA